MFEKLCVPLLLSGLFFCPGMLPVPLQVPALWTSLSRPVLSMQPGLSIWSTSQNILATRLHIFFPLFDYLKH